MIRVILIKVLQDEGGTDKDTASPEHTGTGRTVVDDEGDTDKSTARGE